MIVAPEITFDQARQIGKALHLDWRRVDLGQFRRGLEVELEHGSRDPQTNVTDNDLVLTGKIALAHLKEAPDYYTRLDKMEAETTPVVDRGFVVTRALLICGIAASVLYATMNVVLPMLWPAYSSMSQTVSELSAIDAPTRAIWVPLGIVYAILMTAFAWGVWVSSRHNRWLRVAAGLLLIYGVINIVPWPPMHQREVLAAGGASLTDTLHIVWSSVAVTLMLAAIAFGAAAFDKPFRFYSIVTLVVLTVFGALTFIDSPAVGQNLPTPWLGVWERINIGAFLAWVVVLAWKLMPRLSSRAQRA